MLSGEVISVFFFSFLVFPQHHPSQLVRAAHGAGILYCRLLGVKQRVVVQPWPARAASGWFRAGGHFMGSTPLAHGVNVASPDHGNIRIVLREVRLAEIVYLGSAAWRGRVRCVNRTMLGYGVLMAAEQASQSSVAFVPRLGWPVGGQRRAGHGGEQCDV